MEDTKFYQRMLQNIYAIRFVFMAPTSQKLVGHIGFLFSKKGFVLHVHGSVYTNKVNLD